MSDQTATTRLYRFPTRRVAVDATIFGTDGSVSGRIREAGNRTITLASEKPFVTGERVDLALLDRQSQEKYVDTGIIHRSTPVDSIHEISIFMNRPLPAFSITMDDVDARRDLRFDVDVETSLRSKSGGRQRARLCNYSLSGIGLTTATPLEIGVPIEVELHGDGPQSVMATPHWQIDRDGTYHVGCELDGDDGQVIASAVNDANRDHNTP